MAGFQVITEAAVRGERSPQTELIARSVRSEEPEGDHMLHVARALLNGPAGGWK